jgi:hypothetical protein
MSGSAFAPQQLNIVTRSTPDLALNNEPASSASTLDSKTTIPPATPGSGQALRSLSWTTMALVGLGGWAVVGIICYSLYHLF